MMSCDEVTYKKQINKCSMSKCESKLVFCVIGYRYFELLDSGLSNNIMPLDGIRSYLRVS